MGRHQVSAASAPSLLQQAVNAFVAGKACKVGKVIGPMTYIAEGAGTGLAKIGNITKGVTDISDTEIARMI